MQVLTQLAEHIAHSRPRSGSEQARVAPMPAYGRSLGAPIPDSGLAEVLGDPLTQLAMSISALLPWMALHFRHSPDTPLAAACTAVSITPTVLPALSQPASETVLAEPHSALERFCHMRAVSCLRKHWLPSTWAGQGMAL